MHRSLLLAVAAVGAACTSPDDDLGQVDLSLIGQAASGTAYRLRDAVLTVDGPGGARVFRTEDDLERTHIRERVPSGEYTLQLADGWRLEKLVADGARPVEAELLSPQPLAFQVDAGALASVLLRFRAGAEEVDIGNGDYEISIGVEETPDAGAPDAGAPDAGAPDAGAPDAAPGPRLETSPTQLSVTEGASGSFAVRLTAMPSDVVVVQVLSSNPSVATVSPAELSFTPSTWDQAQEVTVTAPHDDDAEVGTAEVQLGAAGIESAIVPITVADDERRMRFDPTSTTLAEGESRTMSLRLLFRPLAPLTVTLTSSDPGRVRVIPASFAVKPADWNIPQQITLTGLADTDAQGQIVPVRAEATGVAEALDVTVTEVPAIRFLGWPTPGPAAVSLPGDELQLFPVEIDRRWTLQHLQVHAGGSGQVRLVIYSDDDNHPDAAFSLTQPVEVPASPRVIAVPFLRTLDPGRYWFGLITSAPASISAADAATPTTRCRVSMSFTGTFPHGSTMTCDQAVPLAVAGAVRP
jgi:hypothetical protein